MNLRVLNLSRSGTLDYTSRPIHVHIDRIETHVVVCLHNYIFHIRLDI